MRILLLGEFSGVHTNLGKALRDLGHEVMLVSDGDGYRNFHTDLKINTHYINIKDLYKSISTPIKNYNKLTGFDVVQLISPFIFNKKIPFYNNLFLTALKKDNKKLFLVNAGAGYANYESNLSLKYSPCTYCEKLDKPRGCPYIKPYAKYATRGIEKMVDNIIPFCYEYHLAYKNNTKCTEIHNFPIDISNKKIINEINGKIVFFHGMIEGRSGFKGSFIIKKALEKAKEKYPNDIDIKIAGGIPFNDYIKLFSKVNVVVDQVFSYSLAMNALNAMSTGKIVLGGVEPEAYRYLNHAGPIPALNIIPNEDQIVQQVEYIIENRNRIEEWAYASNEFVVQYFDSMKVASHFLKTWSS
jgi:hypothetical protein